LGNLCLPKNGELSSNAMRVLVVEDEALILTLTASWLEDLGCEVETAHDGNEALVKPGNEPRIELLIADVNMPGLSGYELADRGAHMQPSLKVVLLSGAEMTLMDYG
jgi:two-component system, cell cycle response regulator CpdR